MSKFWRFILLIGVLAVVIFVVLVVQYKWVSENDKDGDGKVDEWMRFNIRGQKVEFRRDKNHDGIVDYIEKFKNDRLISVDVDFNYDGVFETKSQFNPKTETITVLERDTNNDGKPDRRTLYKKTNGVPVKTEVDTDHDGIFETVLRDVTKEGE